jgi:hypothetical protein
VNATGKKMEPRSNTCSDIFMVFSELILEEEQETESLCVEQRL